MKKHFGIGLLSVMALGRSSKATGAKNLAVILVEPKKGSALQLYV
ncbi:hypothetical protein [Enterococcus italicus]|nr:hypothetical protein [Enterococcus italicus]